uniref:Secreted protein n=1 Tax=Thraustotheca clavata TaxID=74557 RepID=A0A0A7CLD7_9STRA|nr:secreted protein [Thraustotheca clavata]
MSLRCMPHMVLWLLMAIAAVCTGRHVEVNLTTTYLSSPVAPVLETSAFLAEINANWYFEYIDAVEIRMNAIQIKDNINYTAVALDAALDVLPVNATIAKLLPFVLATRAQSPKIEMFHQLAIESAYKGCGLEYVNATAWAVVYHESGCAAHVVCSIDDFNPTMLTPASDTKSCASSGEHDFELPVDNVYNKELGAPTVTVYGIIGDAKFQPFHKKFIALAKDKKIRYIVRHAPQDNTLPVNLHGYGVSLNIKNMEYKSFDDSRSPHSKLTPTDVDQDEFIVSVMMKKGGETISALKEYQLEFEDFSHINATDDEAPWQLTQLGYLAAQDILTAVEPLQRLQLLSQNFPKYASSLTLTTEPVPFDVMQAMNHARGLVATNQLLNKIVINGMDFDINDFTFNPFDFLKMLTDEVQQGDSLRALNLDDASLSSLHSAMTTLSTRSTDVRIRVRGPIDGTAPIYLNSIESDAITAEWPTDISILSEPAWSLIFLRKVMYEVIVILDPTTTEGAAAMNEINFLLMRGAPIQVGVLWTSNDVLSVSEDERASYLPSTQDKDQATAYHITKLYLSARDHGADTAKQFISGILELNGGVSVKEALMIYTQAVTHQFDDSDAIEEARQLLLKTKPGDPVWDMTDLVLQKQLPLNSHIFNGVVRQDLSIQDSLMSHFGRDQPLYQDMARNGKLAQDSDFVDELLSQESFYSVYTQWLDPSYKVPEVSLELSQEDVWNQVYYMHMAQTAHQPKKQNLLLVLFRCPLFVDLDTYFGAKSAYIALKTTLESPQARVSIIHTSSKPTLGNRVGYILQQLGHTDALPYYSVVLEILRLMSKSKPEVEVLLHVRVLLQVHIDNNPEDKILPQLIAWLESAPNFEHPLVALLNLQSQGLLVNGKLLELKQNQVMTPDLLAVVMQHEADNRSKAVAKALFLPYKHKTLDTNSAASVSHSLYKVLEIVDSYLKTPRVAPLFQTVDHATTYSTKSASLLDVVAYLDPLTEASQRASVFLRMLESVLDAKITLVLVPTPAYNDFPLKRFYRYRWGSSAIFKNLPLPPVLTMNIETPELFNVQMTESDCDVDNVQGDAKAVYAVKSLLVYGQCIDRTMPYHPTPPNGLQVVLERTAGTELWHRDTVVMKNLGYFQLQATPGVWQLELAKGRATELYHMIEADEPTQQTRIIVHDFLSAITQLKVKKRPGQEYSRLLDEPEGQKSNDKKEDEEDQSYWKSLLSWGSGTKQVKPVADTRQGETIHVFSVATGHLYERMLKLMMLSVMKRTQNPVTFWLLENFLSPDFKNSVPALQAKFGMDIRLVTYKWPNWLRRQTEKQRIIWGYKILFLDVLFPLGVQKIIYVDADQVVRADLNELWTMDLHGKPYAYTPFCDSRNVGFQFWRQGYWKDHLRGKPYHISALYVVDLIKFRRMAAGDTLRAIYDQLSADPNSLSNLDQDLPNYAQHQIPIHSLPQEWLWCESWCSDESKAQAKTIDLCNNPKHKEPKLDMAKRVISGEYFKESWLDLDEQVKAAEKAYAMEMN